MKRLILSPALVVAFSTNFVSCRENKKTDDVHVAVDDVNDAMDNTEGEVNDIADDDATDPVKILFRKA